MSSRARAGRRAPAGAPPRRWRSDLLPFGSNRAASVNTGAIRRAGELVPDDVIFHVRAPPSDPRSDNVILAARLFLLPAIQSRSPDAADWILSFQAPVPTRSSGRVYEFDDDLRLAKVR